MYDYDYYASGPFYNNSAINSVIISDGVTSIGKYAFCYCAGITSATIPDGVTSIGGWAFFRCTSLESIEMPDSVTSIGEEAFENCKSLTSITIPYGVTSIGEYVFYQCTSLTSITIPNSVTSIGYGVFENCTSLTSVAIPDSVTSIGRNTFYGCTSLASITIPDSVMSIGEYAFYNTAFYNDEDNWQNGVLYIGNHLIKANDVNSSYSIKQGTKTIADYAFSCCTSITDITMPNSVSSIGENTFYSCINLTSVTLGDSVTRIGKSAFSCCSSLANITIPDSVTNIADLVFEECSSLTSITIPNGVTSIGEWAFYYCTSLTEIKIPDSVTSIGSCAFEFCTSLTSIAIPDSVTSMGDCAFEYCNALTSVTIGNGITSIGSGMFDSCTSLANITIPNSVTSVGNCAFEYCTSLTSITIGNGVTSIDDYVFYGCTSLADVYYNGTEEHWSGISIGNENDALLNADKHFLDETQECEHNITHIKIDATCTEIGREYDKCSKCGKILNENTIPAKGHTSSAWLIDEQDEDATVCTFHKECTVCHEILETKTYEMSNSTPVTGVTLSEHRLYLHIGDEYKLLADVITDNADDESVIWSSDNSDIVSSDSDGTVTAKSAGMAIVSVVTNDGNYFDSCIVVVSAIKAKHDSGLNIDLKTATVSGLSAGMDDISDLIEISDGYTVEYFNATSKIGTGTMINVMNDGEAVNTFTVIIYGDVNGDGWYDGMDAVLVSCIANGILTREQVGEVEYTAADCNHDGVIDELDVELLNQAGLLLSQIDQSASHEELQTNSIYQEYISLIDQTPDDEPINEDPQDNIQYNGFDFSAVIKMIFNFIIGFIGKIFPIG